MMYSWSKLFGCLLLFYLISTTECDVQRTFSVANNDEVKTDETRQKQVAKHDHHDDDIGVSSLDLKYYGHIDINDNSKGTIPGGDDGCKWNGTTYETCKICLCTMIHDLYKIDCSSKNLNAVPKCLPFTTFDLNLSNNNITYISGDSFRNLTRLEALDLSNISLIRLHPNALHNLTNLTSLDVSRNPKFPMTSWTIDLMLFKDLKLLRTLKMYGNTQYLINGTYPDTALSKLRSLQELWIDGLHNKTFGPGFKTLKKLKTVYFSGSYVNQDLVVRYCSTNIPKGMLDNLENVETLTIKGCYIRSIHEDAFNNTRELRYLDLSDNTALELDGVKPAFKSLANTKIEVFKLNHIYDRLYNNCGVVITGNELKGLNKLKNLKELHLEYNAITSVQNGVSGKLPDNLEILNVRNNEFHLGIYMLYIKNIHNLRTLDLSYQFFPNLLWQHKHPEDLNKQLQTTITPDGKYKEHKLPNAKGDYTAAKYDLKTGFDTGGIRSENTGNMDGSVTRQFKDTWISTHQDFLSGNNGFEEHFQNYLVTELEQKRGLVTDTSVDDAPVCQQIPHNILQIVTPALPPNLTYLDLSFSKLAHPIFAFNISETNNLTMVNLSQCMLYCWDGPVNGFGKLEYLDLQKNFCTSIRRSFFDTFPNLKKLIISANLLNLHISTDTEGRLLRQLTKLELLDLSFNRLETIPENFLQRQANLVHLNVSNNLLSALNLSVSHMTKFQLLDLSNNSISTLDKDFRTTITSIALVTYENTRKPLNINLSYNRLHCFCSNLEFLRWLRDSNCTSMNIQVTGCIFENETHADISNERNINYIIGELERQCAAYFALAASLTGLLFFIINCIVGVIVYRYRWKIRYWYYVTKRDMRSGYQPLRSMSTSGEHALISDVYMYHAYVASTEGDRDFVLDNLMPVLKERRLRLCIPEVDFVPGQNLYRMISNAIHSSKVTIFVASSDSFFDNEWEIAMRMAQQESLTRGRTSFFAIFLDEVPMRRICTARWIDIGNMYRTEQFIKYPSQAQAQELELFWNDCARRIRESAE